MQIVQMASSWFFFIIRDFCTCRNAFLASPKEGEGTRECEVYLIESNGQGATFTVRIFFFVRFLF